MQIGSNQIENEIMRMVEGVTPYVFFIIIHKLYVDQVVTISSIVNAHFNKMRMLYETGAIQDHRNIIYICKNLF